MADRKAELERKKEKLRQMREAKEARKRAKAQQDADVAAQELNKNVRTGSGARAHAQITASIDEALADIGITPVGVVLDSITSSGSSNLDAGMLEAGEVTSSLSASPKVIETGREELESLRKKKRNNLSVVTVQSTNIIPKENVTYAKHTQTLESGPDSTLMASRRGAHGISGGVDYYTIAYDDDYEEDSLPGLGSHSPSSESPSGGGFLSKLPPGILPHGMPEVKDVKPAVTKEEEKRQQQQVEKEVLRKRRAAAELSEEEKQAIMMSEEFHKFFDSSTRLVERALCEDPISLLIDYTGGGIGGGTLEDDESIHLSGQVDGGGKSSRHLSLNRCFFDERRTRNRVVTSMDWSAVFPELVAASYDRNPESVHDPDGVCLVWNTRFKKTTPEHVFHCQSPVMSVTFARFHPNLIVGGTYSGQIVLWDNRQPRRTPVQRSLLSASTHTHPVYCTRVVGAQNAHNLISVSTDGRLCSWSLDMLSQPQDTLQLFQSKQSKPVAVTCLSFPAGDVNNFVVGSEEGAVYAACRHGSKAGVLDYFEGHVAPVTGVSSHDEHQHQHWGGLDFGDLFLTSSMDWTVKLWSMKEARSGPLHSFEVNDDYVYDVAWSPSHPAVFASVDGNGRLDLWNLNDDVEVPAASSTTSPAGGPPAFAFNRVSWTPSGYHVTAGDDTGKIWVYDVGDTLAVPAADEWTKLAHTLQEIRVDHKTTPGAGGTGGFEKDKVASCVHPSSLTTSLASSPLR